MRVTWQETWMLQKAEQDSAKRASKSSQSISSSSVRLSSSLPPSRGTFCVGAGTLVPGSLPAGEGGRTRNHMVCHCRGVPAPGESGRGQKEDPSPGKAASGRHVQMEMNNNGGRCHPSEELSAGHKGSIIGCSRRSQSNFIKWKESSLRG